MILELGNERTPRLGFPDLMYELYDMQISYSPKTAFRSEAHDGVFI